MFLQSGFIFYDPRIGTAITLTGQYIIQHIGNYTDGKFNEFFKTTGIKYTFYQDTDSCGKDSLVYVGDKQITIETLFNELSTSTVYADDFNKQYVNSVSGHTTKSFNTQTKCIEDKPIKYVMKHRVKKEMFRITTEDGKFVDVTEDHSVIVLRNHRYIAVSPRAIDTEKDIVLNIIS